MYNYGSLIDKIRKDRNLTRQDLCEDIMSIRNYQRFANNEISISNDKLIMMIDRLGLDYFTFYDIYKSNDGEKFSKIRDAFNLAVKWKFDESIAILQTIDRDSITSSFNKQMYDVTEILAKKRGKPLTNREKYRKLEKAIDYPNILSKNIINFTELNALFIINTKLISKNDDTILNYFTNLVTQDLFSMGFNKNMITGIYASIARGQYSLKNYQQCKDACITGIEESISSERISGLVNFYGYLAFAEDKLGNRDEAINNAIKLYLLLHLEQNEEKAKTYIDILEKNLEIRVEDYIAIKKNDGN